MSARPMKARPRPALRALVRRSVCSESPTGRAMPNRSPEPVGSAVATTIQSPTLVVPAGASAFVTLPPMRFELLLVVVGLRVEPSVFADRERNLAPIAPRRREDRGEQVRQVHFGVGGAHNLAVAFEGDVEPRARERRLSPRGRRTHGSHGSGGRTRRGAGRGLDRGGRRLRFRVRRALRLGDTFLRFGRAELDPLRDAEHALVDLGHDPLAFRLGELLPLPFGHELPHDVAPHRPDVDHDAVAWRGVGIGREPRRPAEAAAIGERRRRRTDGDAGGGAAAEDAARRAVGRRAVGRRARAGALRLRRLGGGRARTAGAAARAWRAVGSRRGRQPGSRAVAVRLAAPAAAACGCGAGAGRGSVSTRAPRLPSAPPNRPPTGPGRRRLAAADEGRAARCCRAASPSRRAPARPAASCVGGAGRRRRLGRLGRLGLGERGGSGALLPRSLRRAPRRRPSAARPARSTAPSRPASAG